MSDVWNIDVTEWWLPRCSYECPPIIRALRDFIAERGTIVMPHDTAAEDVREMKGIFSAMTLDDTDRSTPSHGSGAEREQEFENSTGWEVAEGNIFEPSTFDGADLNDLDYEDSSNMNWADSTIGVQAATVGGAVGTGIGVGLGTGAERKEAIP